MDLRAFTRVLEMDCSRVVINLAGRRSGMQPMGCFYKETRVAAGFLSVEDADECVEEAARAYETMSYTQLLALSRTPEGRWSVVDKVWRGVPIRLTIQVRHFGRIWRRVSVEIAAAAEDESSWPWVPCFYLERFADGSCRKGGTKGSSPGKMRLEMAVIGFVCWGAGLVSLLFFGLLLWRYLVRH